MIPTRCLVHDLQTFYFPVIAPSESSIFLRVTMNISQRLFRNEQCDLVPTRMDGSLLLIYLVPWSNSNSVSVRQGGS